MTDHDANLSFAKVINLAIQGRGAHGAYAWCVIDRLLEDGGIKIEGLPGPATDP